MPEPTSVTHVRGLLGMFNQLSKFIPDLSEKTKPLRDLLQKDSHFSWGAPQKQAYQQIVVEIQKDMELSRYSFSDDHLVMADASVFGLGAVLLSGNQKRPVMFVSHSMTETERQYAQIEKEALAITRACERFQNFLWGKKFTILTDHKLLVPLLSEKDLSTIPVHIQRFRMSLMKFDYTVQHIPGKEMFTAMF